VAGAGTAAGGHVPVTDARTGNVTDKLDASGAPVVTHLNETFLRALAAAGGGRYVGANLSVVPGVTESRLRSLQSTIVDVRDTTIPIERYQWFAAGALALLVLASAMEYLGPIRGRRAFAVGVMALVVLLGSACATRAHDATEDGKAALQRGDADAAVAKFQEASAGHGDDPRVATNLAAALYAAKRYDEAILAAKRALTSNDARARGLAYASIGHAQFAAGRLSDALDAFKRALMENPADEASRHDYEVVLRILEPTPPNDDTPQASPSPSPAVGTPTAGATSPGAGQETTGTPAPGSGSAPATASASITPEQRGESQIQQQLKDIDSQVNQILADSGDNPSAEQALQILQLLAERSRIAQLRDPNGTTSGPNDY